MFKKIATLALAISLGLLPPSIVFGTGLSQADFGKGEAAFAAAKAGDWERVDQIRNEVNDDTLRNILAWVALIRSKAPVSFDDRASFIIENPDWPWQRRLRRLAEKSMKPDVEPATVLSWFERFEPLTDTGRRRLGEALLAAGERDRAREVIRKAWIESDLSEVEQREFLKRHDRRLTKDTHSERLDHLLWNGDSDQAQRMFSLVDSDQRSIAKARIGLRKMSPGVDAAIARVPQSRRTEPGLIYEQIRWHRRKKNSETARHMLAVYPLDQVRPKMWWRERAVLSRRALAEGHAAKAYRVVKGHTLTTGAGFADAEWLSGWIALQFLNDPNTAIYHFERMFNGVKYPISRARGAYWSGRAAESLGNQQQADQWYFAAARHPTAFYGQLATLKTDATAPLRLPQDPNPSTSEAGEFKTHELVRAVDILAVYGQTNRLRPFLLQIGELKTSTNWQAMAASLAANHGQHDLAIAISKQAARNGSLLISDSYPLVAIPKSPSSQRLIVETPLVLAIVRQESAFRAGAVSPAGARGLMQLMPGTARQVANRLNAFYSRTRLTTDPDFNLELGQAYMGQLLQRFGGSYVLALAAYNAGPVRAAEWKQTRNQNLEDVNTAVDWIEQIPYAETRNYVQRVLESLQVYRIRLGRSKAGLTLEDDLTR